MKMSTKLSPMYRDDEDAHEAAMRHFDDEAAPAGVQPPVGLPAMYQTDEAAYEAAEQYFG
ncbi:hypothetical protein [Acidithiobacillus sp.]